MIIPKEIQALERLKNTLLAEGYWQDVLEDVSIIENALNQYYKLLKEDDETTKKLKRLEELEKAFVALSKDDEKAKKLLSKEIEKNRAFEIIKKKVLVIPFLILHLSLNDLNGYNKAMDEKHKLTKEEFDFLKKMML